MGWARIDDTHMDHPKLVEAGPWAELLDVRAICWSARFEQDGRIPDAALKQIGRGIPRVQDVARRLVRVQRWRRASRRDGFDGWVIHDFLDAQPSKAERDVERAKARERSKRYRDRASRNGATRESRSTGQTVRSTPKPPARERDGLDVTDPATAKVRTDAIRREVFGE